MSEVAPPPASRGSLPRWLWLLIGGVIVILVGLSIYTAGVVRYAYVFAAHADSMTNYTETQRDVRSDMAALEDIQTSLSTMAEFDAGSFVSESTSARVDESAAALTDALEAAETATASPVPSVTTQPVLPWEHWMLAADLDAAARIADDSAQQMMIARGRFRDAEDVAAVATTMALEEALTATQSWEQTHVDARNNHILTLRDTRTAAEEATDFSAHSPAAFVALVQASSAVMASHEDIRASHDGPLRDAKFAVESFARELAPGVLLEFTWAPIVNGYGQGASMGGYATWWYDRGGYASIELSDSVAALWPSIRAQSLVAHEVGHAISVKCPTAYDSTSRDEREDWATAWAITQGFTDPANGSSAYGTPRDELVTQAATCR